MANLSEVFIAALRLAAALFGTNNDSANSSSQAPEPSQAAVQEASRPSTSGRSSARGRNSASAPKHHPASTPKPPATPKGAASRDVHISGNQVWDVARRGLPEFSYQPVAENDADPGEVVWTWIS